MKTEPEKVAGIKVRWGNNMPEPQPPATDDKQWTVEPCVGSISGQKWPGLSYIRVGNHTTGSINTEVAKAICDAHNAALAAERENVTLATQMVHIESKRANKAEAKLLSAQAAIAEIKQGAYSNRGRCMECDSIASICDNIDLSALERHDAEVRKPLVDLLLHLHDFIQDDDNYEDNLRRIDAAIADSKTTCPSSNSSTA